MECGKKEREKEKESERGRNNIAAIGRRPMSIVASAPLGVRYSASINKKQGNKHVDSLKQHTKRYIHNDGERWGSVWGGLWLGEDLEGRTN